MFKLRKIIAPLALVGASFAPAAASAVTMLTAAIYDTALGGLATYVEDGGLGDLDGVVNGKILLSDFAHGDGLVSGEIVNTFDADGTSKLYMNVSSASYSGEGSLYLDVSAKDFGSAADPAAVVTFSSNSSEVIGSFVAAGYVNNANVLGLLDDPAGTYVFGGVISSVQDVLFGTLSTVLTDPFSMTIQTTISSGTLTSFDATLLAAVPLPAGGLLLLTALGGLGLIRRRRSAEPALA